jgi:hypothetical protein
MFICLQSLHTNLKGPLYAVLESRDNQPKNLKADSVMGDGISLNLQKQPVKSCGQLFLKDTRCAICKQMTIDMTIDCSNQQL